MSNLTSYFFGYFIGPLLYIGCRVIADIKDFVGIIPCILEKESFNLIDSISNISVCFCTSSVAYMKIPTR